MHRFDRRHFLLVAGAAGLVTGTDANALIDPRLEATGWREMTFREKLGNPYFPDGTDGIRVESRNSVSVEWRSLPADLSRTPWLRWRWRVDRAVPATDLTRKGETIGRFRSTWPSPGRRSVPAFSSPVFAPSWGHWSENSFPAVS